MMNDAAARTAIHSTRAGGSSTRTTMSAVKPVTNKTSVRGSRCTAR